MPVSTVFENFETGANIDEIMEWFDVTREQLVAVLSLRPEVWTHRIRPFLKSIRCPSMRILFAQELRHLTEHCAAGHP